MVALYHIISKMHEQIPLILVWRCHALCKCCVSTAWVQWSNVREIQNVPLKETNILFEWKVRWYITIRYQCSLNLRQLQHTPGTYPRLSNICLWMKSLHICTLRYMGYVPGVCWNFCRLSKPSAAKTRVLLYLLQATLKRTPQGAPTVAPAWCCGRSAIASGTALQSLCRGITWGSATQNRLPLSDQILIHFALIDLNVQRKN